ncbi:MAG: hypothetical protein WBV94_03600 [Blastocatellia bacterium]
MASNTTLTIEPGDGSALAEFSDFNNSVIEPLLIEKQAPAQITTAIVAPADPRPQREVGDQVNRFLLCALVSESAKRVKVAAEKIGESLPMTMIVRGVLRSYRVAAKDEYGPLAKPEPDIAGLRSLNEKVLRDEVARHSLDRVKNSETRLAHAKRLGDDTRIKVEKEGLERAIELRDRLTDQLH